MRLHYFNFYIILFIILSQITLLNSQCETKITASDGAADDHYGQAVSIDGDRVIIGSYSDDDNGSDSGSAYIYNWDGTSWLETKITASDGAVDDHFGLTVSLDGDRAIVGSRVDDDNGSASGSAYIYDWDGTSWLETKITASDGAADDYFGQSVSIDGDRAIVGAYWDDDNGSASGSTYIYEWNGTRWLETKITASEGAVNDYFGAAVSIHGDRAIVGAYLDNDNGSFSGSAYIYDWNGTSWVETKITASDGAAHDYYGKAVSIEGDRVIVGSYSDEDNGPASGSAYIYEWNGNSWVETKITASDGALNDNYGLNVSINGDRAIVGSSKDDDNGSNSGSAYIYDWDGTSWIETKITASDSAADDYYGQAVSIDGERAIVDSAWDDDNGPASGSAYIYDYLPWYEDNDMDTFGNMSSLLYSCTQPSGYVNNPDDCNDNDPNIGAIGTSCDDFNDCTSNTIVQNDCTCGGGTNNLETNIYSDTGSSLWHDSNNWSLMVVPTACHEVIVPAGNALNLLNGETGECYTLQVDQNAVFIVDSGAVLDVVTSNN